MWRAEKMLLRFRAIRDYEPTLYENLPQKFDVKIANISLLFKGAVLRTAKNISTCDKKWPR